MISIARVLLVSWTSSNTNCRVTFLLAVAVYLLVACRSAYAGPSVFASVGWLPVDSDAAVAPVATTFGRAAVCNTIAGMATEDPLRTCVLGNRRVIPPAATAINGLGQAVASEIAGPKPGQKKIIVAAVRTALVDPFTDVEADAFDPISFPALLDPSQVTLDIVIDDLQITTSPTNTGIFSLDFSTSLTGSAPLFSVAITGKDGSVPTVALEVSPFLATQGWNKDSLTGQLTSLLAAGMVGPGDFEIQNFAFPSTKFDVAAETGFDIFNSQQARVPAVPEPSTLLLVSLGLFCLVCYGRRLT